MNLKILKTVFFTPGTNNRWGLPVILEGQPGTAKTSKIQELTNECGLDLQSVIASLREPSDFLGLPIPRQMDDGSTSVEYAAAKWAVDIREAKHGLVFFDEINTAPPAVQAALLRVVFEGVVGELQLPPEVRFIAAMNSTEDAAGGWDLAPPLANRFGHFKWDPPDAEDWGDWLLAGAGEDTAKPGSAAAEEKRVLKAWDGPWAQARGLIAGFIRRRPELLHKMPKPGDPKASKAWPSPRTWEMAARAHAGAQVHGLNDEDREHLIAAFIGVEPTNELCKWLHEADLPDPADILDGKEKFKHDAQRLDRTVAVLSACAAFVAPEKAAKRKARASKLWEILGEVKDAKDVVVPACRTLVRARLTGMESARPVLLALQPVLRAAGVKPQ